MKATTMRGHSLAVGHRLVARGLPCDDHGRRRGRGGLGYAVCTCGETSLHLTNRERRAWFDRHRAQIRGGAR